MISYSNQNRSFRLSCASRCVWYVLSMFLNFGHFSASCSYKKALLKKNECIYLTEQSDHSENWPKQKPLQTIFVLLFCLLKYNKRMLYQCIYYLSGLVISLNLSKLTKLNVKMEALTLAEMRKAWPPHQAVANTQRCSITATV